MSCATARPLLHAYADGELDLIRSLEIEEHLRECSACAQAYQGQQALHAAIGSADLYYPLPAGLERRVRAAVRKADRAPAGPRLPLWGWAGLAAALAVLVLAWGLSQILAGPPNDDLAQQVLTAHVRALMPGHLMDVASTDQHTVKPWFDGRIDFAPPVVDLTAQGFPLTGGRLDYLDNQPVAALVYMREKHVINVFIWPAPGAADRAPAASTRQGYNLLAWTRGGMTFWAVSDLNLAELQQFVALFENPPPAPTGTS